MLQTPLGLLAASLLSGVVLSWPSDLPAAHADRGVAAPDRGPAAICGPHAKAGPGHCRKAAPAQDGSAADAFPDVTVADDLDSCTPFLAIDGDRRVDFDRAHGTVIEAAVPSGPERGDGGAPSRRRVGIFLTNDRTGQVITVIGGVRREYTLLIPAEGTQCILALGAAHAVNLEQSWFGQASDGGSSVMLSLGSTVSPRSAPVSVK